MSIIQDIAIDYCNRGWSPIPLPLGSKAPILTGWQNLRLATEDDVRAYFNGVPTNIGVLLGEPSGGLTDVDLDHPLAVELAPKFLLPTKARFGRLGKPDSHWLYRVSESIKTAKRQAGGLGSIAELRSTGCQTVFPGSVHPSGELIEWTSGLAPDDIQLVDPGELKAAVDELCREVWRRMHPETSGSTDAGGGKTRHTEADLLRRGQGYADKCEPVSPGGRNDKAFRIAGHLYSLVGESGERLSPDDVFELVQSWNVRNSEPLSELELSIAILSANRNGTPRDDKHDNAHLD